VRHKRKESIAYESKEKISYEVNNIDIIN
jgi:hypothetical protein